MRPSTDDLERIEIDAWRDYCAAAPPPFAQAVGLETAELGGPLLAMCKRIDHYQFNRLMGGRLAGDADGGSLAIAAERFRDAGLKNGYLQIAPGGRARASGSQGACARAETARARVGQVLARRCAGAQAADQPRDHRSQAR